MCIIAIKPQGKKMFDDETLETMFSRNPDGSGFMYYDNGTVVIKKGYMTLDALKKALNRKDLTDTNVILHFRIGTSGYYDELNCHPYPIYQKNATVCRTDIGVAHNGILHDYTPPKKSDINDTQVFIQSVLRRLKKGFQKDDDKLMLLSELIGTNKLAFLDSDNQVTIIGDFIEDNGYLFSNRSYEKPAASRKSWGYTQKSVSTSIFDDTDETGFWADWDARHTF